MTPRPRPLRLATWNVEWFNALFDDTGHLQEDRAPSARYRIDRATQAAAIAIVLTALDADGIMVIEAPDTGSRRSTRRALQGFARRFGLRMTDCLHGFTSDTEQEIAFLYDPARLTARHDPQGEPALAEGKALSGGVPRFDTAFRTDLETGSPPHIIRFSKPPLEIALTTAGGHPLRLIGVHAKSKAPHGASGTAHEMRLSVQNRRKQLAECLWIRARVTDHLDRGDDLIVMGDFNDGPGLDKYERLFGRSGVEIVLGEETEPAARLLHDPHARLVRASRSAAMPSTARFWHGPHKRYFEALLDFIMVSPALAPLGTWRIWHPFNDPGCAAVPELAEALLQASDHFPVTLDLALT